MATKTCSHCGEGFVIGVRACPLFPNVDVASIQQEVTALRMRYEEVKKAMEASQESELTRLEAHLAVSCACKGMPRWELERLALTDTATAATYYQQITGRSRIPDDNEWDRLRRGIVKLPLFSSQVTVFFSNTVARWAIMLSLKKTVLDRAAQLGIAITELP